MYMRVFDFIPIILISLFVFYPERAIPYSHTTLGRLTAIMLIVYYARRDVYLGLFICVMTIYYYQLEQFEYMLNISEGFLYEMAYTPYEHKVYDKLHRDIISDRNAFRKTHCTKGFLKHKGVNVNVEITEHVFPQVKFDNAPCNPCDTTCAYSIIERKLDMETELVNPRNSKTSMFSSIFDY
jgi:hypothetical protein